MANMKGLSFYRRRKKVSTSLVKEIFSWIFGIVTAVFIAGVAVWFFGMTTNVVGISMQPTLENGQKILINRFSYTLSSPKRGDVVVFLPNGNEKTHYYVKRVVAIPGDKIKIEGNMLMINGEESPFIQGKILDAGIAENEFTLGQGEFFCIGDNPNSSEDSRSANIGAVKQEYIIGKAWFKMSYGKNKIGFIK